MVWLALWLSFAPAEAGFTPEDASALLAKDVDELIRMVAEASDYKAMMPATPLGPVIGLDVGLNVNVVRSTSLFADAMKRAGVQKPVPAYLPFPMFNLHKGLPWNFDIGMSYVAYQGNSELGGDLKWALVKGKMASKGVIVAARTSYSRTHLFFMRTSSTKFELLASAKVNYFFDPYIGAGMQFLSGDLDVPVGGVKGIPAGISRHYSGSAPYVFIGVPLSLGFIKLTFEESYSFFRLNTYAGKISLYF